MDAFLTLLGGAMLTLVTALAVIGYLNGPLRAQLQILCGSDEGVEFWTGFSKVTLVLTPVVFAMFAEPDPGAMVPPWLVVIHQCKWGLIGLVGSVLMLGWILGRFISSLPPTRPFPRPLQNPGGAI